VGICLEKSLLPFLPTGWFQRCLRKSANPTGEYSAPYTPGPLPPNIIHGSSWADGTPSTKLKNIDSEL
jgi:hypothetical protein